MIQAPSLTLTHLFANSMNIYGDYGNIITLKKRCEWRGIQVNYQTVNTPDDFDKIGSGDIYFFGGGQDEDQMNVWNVIASRKEVFIKNITSEIEKNKVFLLVCGGYQMFGKEFIDGQNNAITGIGILDIKTASAGAAVSTRCIGNIVVTSDLPITPQTLVGFENHGGQTTFLGNKNGAQKTLGKVIKGFGNNLHEKTEGCTYRQVYGTYMHGSLLPKNPHFADYLILQAMRVKYHDDITLSPLDDSLEMDAHNAALLVANGVR